MTDYVWTEWVGITADLDAITKYRITLITFYSPYRDGVDVDVQLVLSDTQPNESTPITATGSGNMPHIYVITPDLIMQGNQKLWCRLGFRNHVDVSVRFVEEV